MKNKKKIIAGILSLYIIFSMTVLYGCIAKNINHHCTGKNCPICMDIKNAVEFVVNIVVISIAIPKVLFFYEFIDKCISFWDYIHVHKTLIILKVELLN